MSQKPEKTATEAPVAKPRKSGRRPSRRAEDYQTGQVLWTFFVALAVAAAALQHVFVEKPSQFSESVAARSPGSTSAPQLMFPERQ